MSKRNRSIRDKLGPIGQLIYWSKAARFYHDGDGAGFVWRWYHPLTWLIAPLMFLVSCALVGIPDTWNYREEIGFRLKPWFVQHSERLEWE